MSEPDPKWLEAVLHKESEEKRVVRIVECESKPAVSKGDNYASDIFRVSMKVAQGNGHVTDRNLIVKSLPVTEMRKMQMQKWGIFKKEIRMYNEVLFCMEELFREFGEPGDELNEPLWPKCLYSKPYCTLVLEDQKNYGFKMASRFEGIGLEEAKLALKELAKFHAASMVLKDREVIDEDDFPYVLVTKNPGELMQLFHDKYFQALSEVIEAVWPPEWKEYADAILALKGNSMEKFKACTTVDPKSKFNVLNHGDFWVNNMMFKYIPDTNIPCGFKMIDFQISHWNSLALDLHYFTTTSLSPDTRRDHMDELMAHYHAALVKFMKVFKMDESKIPTVDELNEEIQKRLGFALMLACTAMPFMKTDPDDVIDMEIMMKNIVENEVMDVNKKPFLGKVFTKLMKIILKEFKQKGLI